MRYLTLLVFTSGAVTLGMELSAARLLEPAFGNNQIIWAALIGLILLYLSLGAWLGGRLADRYPTRRHLELVLTVAAIGVALAPALSRSVLRWAATGMSEFAVGLLAASLFAIVLLFALPGILLGTTTPWVLRLAVQELDQTGRVAGRLTAFGTTGSLLGTFIPVLWLIPSVGTRWTFYLLSLSLLTVLVIGSARHSHRWIPALAWLLVLSMALLTQPGRYLPVEDSETAGEVIYADESLYNTIVVRQWGPERHLKLNEGIGLHSVHHPQMLLSEGIWDYFLLAPLFRPPPAVPSTDERLLLIGLAAGTVSELYTDIYGPMPITGVELDPQIIEIGQRYFEMDQPNLTPIAGDGRAWLAAQPAESRWEIIAVDAYRPPYIPFHLTTVQFFVLTHRHLSDDGVLAINIGRTETNFALVDALAATVGQVYPSVYLIDEPAPPGTLANTLLVATKSPVKLEDGFLANLADLPSSLPSEFRDFAQSSRPNVRSATPPPDTPILTDDRAPVEQIVHRIILDYLTGTTE